MTGRTHDLAAFTALNLAFIAEVSPPDISFATLATAFGANMIGGLLPDIDDATSDIWDKVRGGSFLGKLIKPLVGQHRMLSHSLLGMGIIGFLAELFLNWLGTVVLVNMNIVWWALMIGYVSHLITDSVTKQGVPWLFPVPIRFGFPPFEFLRMKTGGIIEKSLVFPGLILLNAYLVYANYDTYIVFLKRYLE
ncbi:metal-dependent hydrolase [Candidatus Roizmanbacteria bacterium]|nr:metal-dependent hydrolase [Candidatus Roizmanbacteria bacterium]